MISSDPPRDLTFVLGGARSGKSAYAERIATESAMPVTYIATARVGDPEFAECVRLHRERRPTHWSLVEASSDLASALRDADRAGHCVLIDCLTLWFTTLLFSDNTASDDLAVLPDAAREAFAAFDAALAQARSKIIVVSNEIGLGVVPLGSVTRLYVNELGRLNQRVAAASTRAIFMAAGLPLALKG